MIPTPPIRRHRRGSTCTGCCTTSRRRRREFRKAQPRFPVKRAKAQTTGSGSATAVPARRSAAIAISSSSTRWTRCSATSGPRQNQRWRRLCGAISWSRQSSSELRSLEGPELRRWDAAGTATPALPASAARQTRDPRERRRAAARCESPGRGFPCTARPALPAPRSTDAPLRGARFRP
jgi:hypothetical protein